MCKPAFIASLVGIVINALFERNLDLRNLATFMNEGMKVVSPPSMKDQPSK